MGVLPGALVFILLANDCQGDDCGVAALILGSTVASAGAAFGMVVGISGGAKLLDGRGEPSFAFAGMLAGAYGTYLIANQLKAPAQEGRTVGFGVAVVSGAVLCGSIAYEISHHRNVEKERSRLLHPQVAPMVTTTSAGGLIGGLTGRF